MKYRSEIDGLRALAVLPVIFFHAGFLFFSGGYIGVDVFFVISGYLITTILIKDIENNKFSLINFYERRARRILPALFLMMMVSVIFAWAILVQPDHKKDFAQSLVAVSAFASNFLFWIESDYFDVVSEQKPLLHTWSLAVEEQYYLLFPIFLFLVWRFGKNFAFWTIIFFTAISLLLSEWGWRNFPSANFYLAPTRAWELLAGSIAAFIIQKRGIRRSEIISIVGLLAIIFSIFVYDEFTPFPSLYALVPVLGTVLIILYADKKTRVGKLLSLNLFVGIGLISYSAYLWHQPIFAFSRILMIDEISSKGLMVMTILTLFIAYLSWRYAEQPFRDRSRISKKIIFNFSIFGIITFTLIGFYGNFNYKNINSGFLHPYKQLYDLNIGSYQADNQLLQKKSWSILDKQSVIASANAKSSSDFDISNIKSKILITGNSHSKDIFNIFFNNQSIKNKFQIARYGTQISDLEPGHPFWDSLSYIDATHIVIASRYREVDIKNLAYVLEKIKKDKKNIFIVSHIFEFPGEASGFSLIDKTVHLNIANDPEVIAEKVNSKYYEYYVENKENRSHYFNGLLYNLGKKYEVNVLNRMDYICSDQFKKCYVVQSDLTKNFYDYGHHTLKGAEFYAKSDMINKFINLILKSIDEN